MCERIGLVNIQEQDSQTSKEKPTPNKSTKLDTDNPVKPNIGKLTSGGVVASPGGTQGNQI